MILKILYFMHVDWNWIKQRPHFIVEGLADQGYQIDVVYPVARNRRVLADNSVQHENITLRPYYRAPYAIRNNRFLNRVSNTLSKIQLPSFDYEVIFLTYPEQIELIPKSYKGKIIYDCMDDHSAFDGVNKEQLRRLEKEVITASYKIIVSSSNLLNKIATYTNKNRESFVLVRNALGSQLNLSEIQEGKQFNGKVAYLGTISEWIDFDTLINALDNAHNDVCVDFIGPVTVDVPNHPKIRFLGSIDSSHIKKALEPYGTFIMPFMVNELIRSVDPVKFYEYIHLGGNIVSCKYPEIERFSSFVNFYHDSDSLLTLINKIGGTSVDSIESRRNFLNENTWFHRVGQVKELLENVDG
ncbi:TPA: hypothetical protein RQL27_002814 [Vibrio vulnificus]|nr:hypothetical protein [Vibrio vulnificus]